jgi:hypothetical protein
MDRLDRRVMWGQRAQLDLKAHRVMTACRVNLGRQFASVVLCQQRMICRLISRLMMLVKALLLRKMVTCGFGKETVGLMLAKLLAHPDLLVQLAILAHLVILDHKDQLVMSEQMGRLGILDQKVQLVHKVHREVLARKAIPAQQAPRVTRAFLVHLALKDQSVRKVLTVLESKLKAPYQTLGHFRQTSPPQMMVKDG